MNFTEQDGLELAVAMLREIESRGETCSIESAYREGPQENIVLRYLETMRSRNSSELERGFAAMLTEVCYSITAGSCPNVDYYEGVLSEGRHL